MPASFSGKVKKELASVPFSCKKCNHALLTGMFVFSRASRQSKMLLHTEHKCVSDLYVSELTEQIGAIIGVTIHDFTRNITRRSYTVTVDDETDLGCIFQTLALPEGLSAKSLREQWDSNCCLQAFLRGVFLVCGSIIDPQKEYHLEFVIPEETRAALLSELLTGIDLKPKKTKRKGNTILYFKESEHIEDLLTLMGAPFSSLELMNVKIVKDVRNKVNRVTNCETANIDKTVSASSQQVQNIRLIERKIGLSQLPDDLQTIAAARLENPDLSLRELGEILPQPLSRSGVNHRLKRLEMIAKELQ